jgi:uncharacterized protein (DUF433 family)
MKMAVKRKETNHFHIAINKNICGGTPIVKGTRISVANIAGYYVMGLSPEEIQRELPHLSLAQIFDAMAFYLDHRQMIDKEFEKNREENISKEYPAGTF